MRARGSARGRRRWTRHRRRARLQQQKARSAAACSIVSAAVPCRFRALPLDVVRLDIPREHRVRADLLHEGACRATASAPSSADTCPGRQSTPNEKPHALGRWGPKRPKLAQRTGTRTPGRVSAPLIGSTRWLFFGRAASRGAEMRATLQHCNRTWALDGLPRSDSM